MSLSAASYYVATNGSNSADGLSTNTAWKTIQYAVDQVVAGDTINVRGGDYREFVNCSNTAGCSTSWITIQAYSNEVPVVKGSDIVTGWILHSGGIWKQTNWTQNAQQVFIDGKLLQQIGWPNDYLSTNAFSCDMTKYIYIPYGHSCSEISPSRKPAIAVNGLAELFPYSFFYDKGSKTLYIRLNGRDNPNDHLVEVSTRTGIFYTWNDTRYIHIKGLHFRHNNSFSTTQHGWPGILLGNSCILENSDVQWCDASGVSFYHNAKLMKSNVSNNGMDGARVASATNVTISSCTITYNNYRNITGNYVGAIKYHPDAGGTVESNEIAWNRSCGIWFDTCDKNYPIVIRNNRIHHHRLKAPGASSTETFASGIFIEASRNADIHDNLIFSNAFNGINLSGSANVRFYNNTVVGTFRPRGANPSFLTSALYMHNPWSGHPVTYNRIFNNVFAYNNTEFDIYSIVQNSSTVYSNLVNYNTYYRHPNAYEIYPPTNWKTNDGLIYPGASFCNAIALGNDSTGYTNHLEWMTATEWDYNSIAADPLLQVYRLATNSPCVDSGMVKTFMNLSDDLDGNPRITDAQIDMGTFELGTLVCDFQQNVWTGIYPLAGVFSGAGAGTNGQITWYGWDFDNDGTADVHGAQTAIVSNTFCEAGMYPVTLMVSNIIGETAARTHNVDAVVRYPPDSFSFRAFALTNSVSLRWSAPADVGYSNELAHVRYSTNTYPTDVADGTSLVTTTSCHYVHTNLTSGRRYYYTIWFSQNGTDFVAP